MIDTTTKVGLRAIKNLEGEKMTVRQLEHFVQAWFPDMWFHTANYYGDDCTEILSDEDVESDNPCINGMNLWEIWFSPVEGDVDDLTDDSEIIIGDVDIWEPEENWK